MKLGALLILILLPLGRVSHADATENFPPDDPPFYTMGWQELNDLTDKQKSTYMNLLLRDLPSLPIQEKTPKDLEQVTFDNTAWEKFQLEIYDICHRRNPKAVERGCHQLENDRLSVLESMSVDHKKHIRN